MGIVSSGVEEFTVGVEEEYQLVDPLTGSLRSRASAVRATDWSGDIAPELQETTIEIGTEICSSSTAVQDELARLRFQAATAAEATGVTMIAAGIHPFSCWEGHHRPPERRYQEIEARYGRIARDEHIYGMHVHVGVPEGADRVAYMNGARHALPELLALSASSPYFEGADTGFDSYRTILWRRWPNSGIPPRFRSAAEYESFVQTLLATGTIADRKNLYWSLRVHPKYPTLEFRVTDVCPNLEDAVAIATLARCVVFAVADGRLGDHSAKPLSMDLEQEMLRVNEWRAARDGLGATVVDVRAGGVHQPVRDAIRQLLDQVRPAAEQLGEVARLEHVERILERGNAAERMRAVEHEPGDLAPVVEWLARETLMGTGLDRRRQQRELA